MIIALPSKSPVEEPWALRDLPPFPWITTKILQLFSRRGDDVDIADLTELIRSDASLSTELLRRANSALFGMRSQVDSVNRAVTMIGLDRVRGLALTLGMGSFVRTALRIAVLRLAWRHSLASALLAEELAEVCGLRPDQGYTAGLLHDIGRLGLLVKYPESYADLLSVVAENNLGMLQSERDLFDIDHCEAGAWLAEKWNFPPALIEVIGNHHQEHTVVSPPLWRLAHLACRLAGSLGFDVIETVYREPPEAVLAELPRPVQLGPDDLEELKNRTSEKVDALE